MMKSDDYLQMSGIQHFCFCRRQWALAYMEMQWSENLRTAEGRLAHQRCHDEESVEKRGDLLVVRGMRVQSKRLGLSGACDVVEFKRSSDGVDLQGYEGTWIPFPVEYKHGHEKENDADRLQLCAQAMALEEMLVCDIPQGSIFYIGTKRRERVIFTDELRHHAVKMAEEMHDYFRRGYTPKVKVGTFCNACSLKELCVPKLCSRADPVKYIRQHMEEP